MTTTVTAQPGVSARALLLGSSTDDVTKLRRALSQNGVITKVGGPLARLSPQGREAASDTLASVTAGVLDVDLGDALVYGLRTNRQLMHAAEETQRVRGRQEVVELASYQVSWNKELAVDLLVDGAVIHTFCFKLTLNFEVQVAAAVIQYGKLVALKSGDSSVTGTLTLPMLGVDLTLLHEKLDVNLHLIVRLGDGVPLASDKPDPAATSNEANAAGEQTVPA